MRLVLLSIALVVVGCCNQAAAEVIISQWATYYCRSFNERTWTLLFRLEDEILGRRMKMCLTIL